MPAEFWDHPAMIDALASQNMGRVIKAWRTHPHHGRDSISQERVARWAGIAQPYLSRIETGRQHLKNLDLLTHWVNTLHIPHHQLWFAMPGQAPPPTIAGAAFSGVDDGVPQASADVDADWTTVAPPDLDDLEAVELIRRVEASDTGPATIAALEQTTDLLARSYTSTPPAELLTPLRAHRDYVTRLLAGQATLVQRRELMVLGGWLSLLTATCDIDLRRYRGTVANLAAARTMAAEADHSRLTAWVLETEAWQALTNGRADRAVELSQAARALTSPGTSVHVQTTIQEARATARLELARETPRLLDESARSLDQMAAPAQPEHHFTFDRRKHISYTATALSWLGDDSADAEEYARQAVAQYDTAADDGRWRSRLASARLDLALILARSDQPTEAAALGQAALSAGYLRSSNMWRAVELDQQLIARYDGVLEIESFHEQIRDAAQGVVRR